MRFLRNFLTLLVLNTALFAQSPGDIIYNTKNTGTGTTARFLTPGTSTDLLSLNGSGIITRTPQNTFAAADHTQAISTITGLQTALDAKLAAATAETTYAPISNPTFQGIVTIPTGALITGYLTTADAATADAATLNASNLTAGTLPIARLADGSVTNTKLLNSSITLNGTSVSLGGSLTIGTAWGGITGTLSDQTDLQSALNGKLNNSAAAAFQPVDTDLIAIAALTTTTFGRSFLTLANASAGRTALELGTLATQSANISDYLPLAGGIMAGAIALPAGSTSAPALRGPADADTGIYFSTAGNIDFTINGTRRVYIDSNGTIQTNGSGIQITSGNLISNSNYFSRGGSYYLGSSDNVRISTGTATPEGAVTANVGTLFLRQDGGTASTLYVKQSGTGNTGWVTYQASSDTLTTLSNTTAAGLALMDDEDAAAQRTTLGLGTLATQSATITDYLTTSTAASTYAPINSAITIAGTSTSLGGAITLDSILGLSTTGLIKRTGTNTLAIATADTDYVVPDDQLTSLAGLSYTGNGGKFIRVNAGATGFELATISGGGDALTTSPLSQFASTTSSQFAGVISDETGTGAVVLANSPSFITPNLDTPSAVTLTNATGLPLSTGVTGSLPIANGGHGQTSQTAGFNALAPTTTKGDLIVHDGTDNVRLAGGTDGHVLTRDSSAASGVKWAAAAGGSGGNWVLISTTTISGSPSTLEFTFSGSYRRYRLELENVYGSADGYQIRMRTSTNGGSTFDSGTANYGYAYGSVGTYGPISTTGTYMETSTNFVGSGTDEGLWGTIDFYDPLNAGLKTFAKWELFGRTYNSASPNLINGAGYRDSVGDVDTVRLLFSSGTFAGGKVRLFGWSE